MADGVVELPGLLGKLDRLARGQSTAETEQRNHGKHRRHGRRRMRLADDPFDLGLGIVAEVD